MRLMSSMLGALGLAVAAGLSLGMTTPTTPLTRDGDPFAAIPKHEVQSISHEQAAARQPERDQFPLETPEGVIPVRELAYHGRLRNRMRDQPLYGASSEAEADGLTQQSVHVEQAMLDAAQPEPSKVEAANYVPLEPGVFDEQAEQMHVAEEPATRTVEISVGYSDNG